MNCDSAECPGCEFTCRLFHDPSEAEQIGPALDRRAEVTNGLFRAANVDFDANVIDGRALWLEMQYQCAGDTASTAPTPRHCIAPAPFVQ